MMPRRIRVVETQSMRMRKVKPDAVPPIFVDVPTTKILAALAGVGPCNVTLMQRIQPTMVGRWISGLKRLERLGIVYSFEIIEMRGRPRIYSLNRGHDAYWLLRALALAIWKSSADKAARAHPETPFCVPAHFRRDLSSGEQAWRSGKFIGGVLHLLAEIQGPVERTALFELLRPSATIRFSVDRLIGYGLVRERRAGIHRFIALNSEHPLQPYLRRWLRWVNRHATPRFIKLADAYRRNKLAGEYEMATRQRRSRAAKGSVRQKTRVQPSKRGRIQ